MGTSEIITEINKLPVSQRLTLIELTIKKIREGKMLIYPDKQIKMSSTSTHLKMQKGKMTRLKLLRKKLHWSNNAKKR